MKRFITIFLLSLLCFTGAAPRHRTDFNMTVFITNKSGETKRLYLEKGRILEIARLHSSDFQSVIITEGGGWVSIPPGRTIQRQIKGICLQKGLRFPRESARIVITPFSGSEELIAAGNNQEAVHKIVEFPRDNVSVIVAKGYSDTHKDGRAADYEEAFKAAVENASRESGFTFTSETILENLQLIRTKQRINVKEKSIKLLRIIHEEYNEKTGEFLYIGEFEVRSKPPPTEIK